MVTLWWEGAFEFGERVFIAAEELDPYLADFVTSTGGRPPWRRDCAGGALSRRLRRAGS